MSTDYYVVCDQCRVMYWAWRRSAGGVNPPPIGYHPDAFQAFLAEHLHRNHPLRFVSEHSDAVLECEDVHPDVIRNRETASDD